MKKIILFIFITFLITLGLNAQNMRIAYIDSNRIMAESNDTREAQRLFQSDRENWDSQIDDIQSQVHRLETELETRRLTLTESGKREVEERITAKKREGAQLLESIYGENGLAEKRNADLLAPIMSKLRNIIDRIAEDDNYTIIFDASTSGIIYANDRMDITQQVIIEMNKAN